VRNDAADDAVKNFAGLLAPEFVGKPFAAASDRPKKQAALIYGTAKAAVFCGEGSARPIELRRMMRLSQCLFKVGGDSTF
jgi:hypothetical protein